MNRISQGILNRDNGALLEAAKIHPNLDAPQDRRQAIALAFSKGTDDPSVCFLHGTSLAVLDHALLTGVLPGGMCINDEGISRLYFVNLPSRFSYAPEHCALPIDDSSAQKSAESYAGSISSEFDSIIALEGELSRIKGRNPRTLTECLKFRAGNYWFPSVQYESEGLDRKSAERIEDTFDQSNTPNKILLGFNSSFLNDYPINEAELSDEGLWVNVKEGIPLSFLTAVKPLTQHGYDYLTKIQQSLNAGRKNPLKDLKLP